MFVGCPDLSELTIFGPLQSVTFSALGDCTLDRSTSARARRCCAKTPRLALFFLRVLHWLCTSNLRSHLPAMERSLMFVPAASMWTPFCKVSPMYRNPTAIADSSEGFASVFFFFFSFFHFSIFPCFCRYFSFFVFSCFFPFSLLFLKKSFVRFLKVGTVLEWPQFFSCFHVFFFLFFHFSFLFWKKKRFCSCFEG